jgi:haloacid dehalogenase superfamily, subfamily IA, variant 3 with third motif having DD or ED
LIGVVLKKYDVEKYFDEMINCEMVGADKTEPKIFEEAMKLLGGSKDDTVIFEDAYYAIKTAKNADFKVVGVYDEVEDEPDKVKEIVDLYIEDYKDINRILNV